MSTTDKNIFLYGNSNPLPQKHLLRAGILDVVYENTCLRYISVRGIELVRNIYSAVRDKNWDTILPEIVEETINQQKDGFTIFCKVRYTNPAIDFLAEYQVIGKEDSSIKLIMKGKALQTFTKNRIGFCVLHPIKGLKGIECTITNPQGEKTTAIFPEMVSPHSPMMNIQALAWENELAECRLTFEGDTWEMEDQRNWTDSSFKTFCTPLSIPYPTEIQEDTAIEQQITLNVKTKNLVTEAVKTHTFLIDKIRTYKFPKIGLSNTTTGDKLLEAEASILRKAKFNHLRFDLKFSENNWQEKFENALYNAEVMNVVLELVLHFTDNIFIDLADCQYFAKIDAIYLVSRVWFVEEKKRISTQDLIDKVIKDLRKIFPDASIGAGVDAHFAALNRHMFNTQLLDFITFAITPQAHAFDNDTLIENIEAQTEVLDTAKKLYPTKQVQISPITLRQRFNVVAIGGSSETSDNQLPYSVDERQMSLFAAGWTLGSIAALIKGECSLVTYYETVGWEGVIQGEHEPPKPDLFMSKKSDIFPVYHLFSFLNQLQPKVAQLCTTSHPLKFSALKVVVANQSYLLLANHTKEYIDIQIDANEFVFYKSLDEETILPAYRDSLFLEKIAWKKIENQVITLHAYALVFVK
jgi:hypothetical protein